MTDIRLLLTGHDTVECAYFLEAPGSAGNLDFRQLAVEKEMLRQANSRDPKVITLGGMEFLLYPYGASSGYPFVIENPDFTIAFGEFNNPSFFVKFRSLALWRYGAQSLNDKFMRWADGLGFSAFRDESLSRVDFTFDYHLPVRDFDENAFVSLASKDVQYRNHGNIQTFQFGKGDIVLRVYNKVDEIKEATHKTWFYDLWGSSENVWRVEWQVRKVVLRRFGIRTFADLDHSQGDLLRYLCAEHTTLRVPTRDSNRSRWPLHPLWEDLQGQVASMRCTGIYRDIKEPEILAERLMRVGIGVYGYLKRVAAIQCIRNEVPELSLKDTLTELECLVNKVHDPLTWEMDVQKRIDQIRLGQ